MKDNDSNSTKKILVQFSKNIKRPILTFIFCRYSIHDDLKTLK
jgi:hypothetical protein